MGQQFDKLVDFFQDDHLPLFFDQISVGSKITQVFPISRAFLISVKETRR